MLALPLACSTPVITKSCGARCHATAMAAAVQGIDMGALKRQQEQLMILAFGGSDLVQVRSGAMNLRQTLSWQSGRGSVQ